MNNLLTNIDFWSAICGFIGTIMLFFFGLPPHLNKRGAGFLILRCDKKEAEKYKIFLALSYVALGLIAISFLLQIIRIAS